MPFIDGNDPARSLLIGPADGARRIFRERAQFPAGFFVGLHTHRGDESFEVMDGEIRFYVGGERKVCGRGAIVFAPPGIEHGFVVLTDARIEIFSEQKMGVYVVVLEPDGRRRVEEIYIRGFPSSNEPPAGAEYTRRERVRALYGTTEHLL